MRGVNEGDWAHASTIAAGVPDQTVSIVGRTGFAIMERLASRGRCRSTTIS